MAHEVRRFRGIATRKQRHVRCQKRYDEQCRRLDIELVTISRNYGRAKDCVAGEHVYSVMRSVMQVGRLSALIFRCRAARFWRAGRGNKISAINGWHEPRRRRCKFKQRDSAKILRRGGKDVSVMSYVCFITDVNRPSISHADFHVLWCSITDDIVDIACLVYAKAAFRKSFFAACLLSRNLPNSTIVAELAFDCLRMIYLDVNTLYCSRLMIYDCPFSNNLWQQYNY